MRARGVAGARGPSFADGVRAIRRGSRAPLVGIGLGLLAVVALLQYAHAVMNTTFNPWDDEMAYRAFIRSFLDTGTLTDGLSFRRVGAYGGQSLLQAMVLALTDRDRVHILDNGICLLAAFGLLTGYRRGSRGGPAALVAALLLLTLPYYLHNLGGEYSGLIFFLALFRLYDDPGFEQAAPRTNAILAGLLTAAICTLRQNYISAAVLFVALVYLALLVFPGARRREEWLRQGMATAAAIFVFLLPWMVLSTIAIHTPFYPVIRGNVPTRFRDHRQGHVRRGDPLGADEHVHVHTGGLDPAASSWPSRCCAPSAVTGRSRPSCSAARWRSRS